MVQPRRHSRAGSHGVSAGVPEQRPEPSCAPPPAPPPAACVRRRLPQDPEEARQDAAALALPPVLHLAPPQPAVGAGGWGWTRDGVGGVRTHTCVRACMPACPASLLRQSPPHPPTTTTLLQGNYSDLLVILSAVYSDLRGDRGPMPQGDDAFAEVRGAAGHIGGGWGGVLTRGLPLACLPSFLGFRAALVLPCSGTICSTTKYSLPPSVLNPFPNVACVPTAGHDPQHHQVLGAHERRVDGEAPHPAAPPRLPGGPWSGWPLHGLERRIRQAQQARLHVSTCNVEQPRVRVP